jgi:hypothetical protein
MTTIIQRIADAILEARIKSWSLARCDATVPVARRQVGRAAVLDIDAQVVELVAYKVYPNEHTNALNVPGCKIFVVQMI